MLTKDNYSYSIGDVLFLVGKYSNQKWFINPKKIKDKLKPLPGFYYFKIHKNGRNFIKEKESKN